MRPASLIPLGGLRRRRSMGASARPPGGHRSPAPTSVAPRRARPGSAAYGFRKIAARPARLSASCCALRFLEFRVQVGCAAQLLYRGLDLRRWVVELRMQPIGPQRYADPPGRLADLVWITIQVVAYGNGKRRQGNFAGSVGR